VANIKEERKKEVEENNFNGINVKKETKYPDLFFYVD
jgi:hypothetical protein